MPTRKNLGLFILVSVLTVVMTMPPYGPMMLASLPARYLRLGFGRLVFWVYTVGMATALFFYSPAWALALFILLLLIGLYADLEQNKVPTFYAGAVSVFFAAMSLFFLIATWARAQHMSLVPFLRGQMNLALAEEMKQLPMKMNVTVDMMLSMMPGLVAATLMIILGVSALLVKSPNRTEKMSAFRAPDAMVWVFIASLAGTFLVDPIKGFYVRAVAENVLFLCTTVYYFQGLAVLGFFLQRLRVNYFVKTGIFILFAFYLVFFVPALGLSDVWFSYRSKWYKKLLKDNPRRDV